MPFGLIPTDGSKHHSRRIVGRVLNGLVSISRCHGDRVAPAPSREVKVKSPLIAIVDDDEALCASLVDLMRSVGYRAEPFFRADALLVSPHLSHYDYVIADVGM